jgi:hypothetical protein
VNSLRTLEPDADDRNVVRSLNAMSLFLILTMTVLMVTSCGISEPTVVPDTTPAPTLAPEPTATPTAQALLEGVTEPGPGGFGFDRSDPVAGIANIMEAFAVNEATATCIHNAWGDLANVPPADLTAELMTYEICGTSIFQMISGDPRFTGRDG